MPERREIDNPQAVAQLAVRLVVFLIEALSRLLFFLVITAMWILAGTVETRGTLWRRRLESKGVQNLERLRELCSQALARLDYVIHARVNLELQKQQRQLRELEERMKLEKKGKKKLKAKGGIKIKDKGEEEEEEKEKKKEEEENEKKKGKKIMGAKGGIKIKEKGEEEDEEKEKKKEEEEEEENGDGGGGRKKDGE